MAQLPKCRFKVQKVQIKSYQSKGSVTKVKRLQLDVSVSKFPSQCSVWEYKAHFDHHCPPITSTRVPKHRAQLQKSLFLQIHIIAITRLSLTSLPKVFISTKIQALFNIITNQLKCMQHQPNVTNQLGSGNVYHQAKGYSWLQK